MVATYSVIECNVSIMCCCMPAMLSFLRRAMPGVFDSNRSLEYNNTPFANNGIQKSVTYKVSYIPRAEDTDIVELVDKDSKNQGFSQQRIGN